MEHNFSVMQETNTELFLLIIYVVKTKGCDITSYLLFTFVARHGYKACKHRTGRFVN